MALRPHFPKLVTRLGPAVWRAVRFRRSDVHSLDNLAGNIKEACQSLLDFDACSGGEFNAIAETIGALDSRLSDIRKKTLCLNLILADQDEDRAMNSAFEVYRKSVDITHASIGLALSQEEQMAQMEERLLSNRARFSKNSLLFRVLVTSMRMEAARIDPEHRVMFATVADEIDTMQQDLSATVDTSFQQIETIVNEAADGRRRLQDLQGSLHGRAQQSIGLLRDELAKIKKSLAPCAQASDRIGALLEEARKHTAGLITSLQYQDIVRQQLEHVSQGFDDIVLHLEPTDGTAVDRVFLHHAARVQQTQLQVSRTSINGAATCITDGGRALLETGAALAAHFTDMGRAAHSVFSESRVGELFSHETKNLMEVASMSDSTHHRIGKLLERIDESVRMFSTDIRRHEFNVQLVALNAEVAAARVPGAGALSKLAEETSRLAAITVQLTREVGAQMEQTLERLHTLRQESTSSNEEISREKNSLVADAATVNDKLARLNDRIRGITSEATAQFDEAYKRARELLTTLRFPGLIATTYEPSETACTRMLEATAASSHDELGEAGAERLSAHRSRYTMHEERTAHATAIGAVAAVGVAASFAQAAPAGTSTIDLFDDDPAPPPPPAPADDGVELF